MRKIDATEIFYSRLFYPFSLLGDWAMKAELPNRKVSENLAFQLPYIIFAQQRA